ncbi:hypothetical protein MTP03_03090 [Tsukamurella sp. PLM1]|nr:hypothetical protein MTP03_03090 [Tsukamurella sp. PLM1]
MLVPLTSFSSTNFSGTFLRVMRSKYWYSPPCSVPAGKRYCRPLRSGIFTAGVLSPGAKVASDVLPVGAPVSRSSCTRSSQACTRPSSQGRSFLVAPVSSGWRGSPLVLIDGTTIDMPDWIVIVDLSDGEVTSDRVCVVTETSLITALGLLNEHRSRDFAGNSASAWESAGLVDLATVVTSRSSGIVFSFPATYAGAAIADVISTAPRKIRIGPITRASRLRPTAIEVSPHGLAERVRGSHTPTGHAVACALTTTRAYRDARGDPALARGRGPNRR